MLRLEVRHRTLLLDERDYVFVTEDGVEVEKTTTEGVVSRVERFVKRRLRGPARVHGRAQTLQSLRQFNSPKEGLTQFVAVEATSANRLLGLEGPGREAMLDDVVVRAVQARAPVDLQAIERWTRERGLYIGLTGKNQVLGGKVRLATEGIVSDFEPEKLLARSLLDKPDAFRGEAIRLLVVDDPFVDAVTGDGAFLLRATAPRACERVVQQRVRRCLDYEARDARRGETYLRLEFEDKVARYDTEILEVVEDGDLLHIKKRERARIDTGAKLVHESGFKGTAIVVDRLPDHIEHEWPGLDGVVNASCIKSNALLSAHSQEAMWGNFQRAFLLHLPVRMLFTGEERFSTKGKGRKGTSGKRVHGMFEPLDPTWAQRRTVRGLSSGEGLIWHVRDAEDPRTMAPQPSTGKKRSAPPPDPGIEDKRLLVLDGEFASTLRVLERDGNTLSPVLRTAWDGDPLSILTKNWPAISTDAHVSLIGHVTREEVVRYLDRTEMANGFANRILWTAVRRSKLLPEGGSLTEEVLAPLREALGARIVWAQGVGELQRSAEMRALGDRHAARAVGCPVRLHQVEVYGDRRLRSCDGSSARWRHGATVLATTCASSGVDGATSATAA